MTEKLNSKYLSNLNKKQLVLLCIGSTVFVKVLVLSFLTPLMSDDFIYNTSASILNALQNEHEHYMTWGGRSVVHFIVRIILMFPKIIFNILNAFVYVGLTFLIYKIANPKEEFNISLYLFIVFSIWLYTLRYDQVILWLTGAINYLWGTVIILSFLLPYCLYITGNLVFSRKYLPVIGMFLLGVIAGWCNENTSGGMIFIVLLILLYCKIFKQYIKTWMVSGLIGSITGFLFMVLAPGNSIRSQHPHFFDDRHTLVVLSERFTSITGVIQNEYTMLIMIFIILVIMQIVLNRDWKQVYISFTFFIASIASAYVMIFAPFAPRRSLFGVSIFLLIACAYSLAKLSIRKEPYIIALISFICILAFQFSTSFVIDLRDFAITKVAINRIEAYIKTEVALGNYNIVLPNYLIPCPQSRRNPMFWELARDTSHWLNNTFVDKFDLESIKLEEKG